MSVKLEAAEKNQFDGVMLLWDRELMGAILRFMGRNLYRKSSRLLFGARRCFPWCAVTIVFLIAGRNLWGCGISWEPTTSPFPYVNRFGEIENYFPIAQLAISEKLSIPIYAQLFSKRQIESGLIGFGMAVPFLESQIFQIDQNQFEFFDPAGRRIILTRKKTDSNIIEGGGWKGVMDDHIIVLSSSCGWSCQFSNGKILSLKSSEGKLFQYNYSGGRLKSVSVKGRNIIDIEDRNDNISIFFNETKEFANFKRRNVPFYGKGNFKDVIENLVKLAVQIQTSNYENYNLSWKIAEDQSQVEVKKLGSNSNLIQWNTSSGIVSEVDGWKYFVDPNIKYGWKISRSSNGDVKSTELSEAHFDSGIRRNKSAEDAFISEEHFFTSGPAVGKTRSLKKIDSKGNATLVEERSYNELGQLQRITRENDIIYLDYQQNRIVSVSDKRGNELYKYNYDENGNLISINLKNRNLTISTILQKGNNLIGRIEGTEKSVHFPVSGEIFDAAKLLTPDSMN